MIGIVDYGAGNLFSVQKALNYLGVENSLITDGNTDWNYDGVILPGVGSFGFAMEQIRQRKLEKPLQKWLLSGKPFLGICLGIQLLMTFSEESPGCTGLAFFPGTNHKFTAGKVPQIGWNQVQNSHSRLLRPGLGNDPWFYFVHGYYVVPEKVEVVSASGDYYQSFPAVMEKGHIFGVQFHPEKSGTNGLKLLKNWVDLC